MISVRISVRIISVRIIEKYVSPFRDETNEAITITGITGITRNYVLHRQKYVAVLNWDKSGKLGTCAWLLSRKGPQWR